VRLTPHGRAVVGPTGGVAVAVWSGAVEVRCATALCDGGRDDTATTVGDASAAELGAGTDGDPAAIELGAPVDAVDTTGLACVAAVGRLVVQPEIASVRPTPRTAHRNLWWSVIAVAKRVVAALRSGAEAR